MTNTEILEVVRNGLTRQMNSEMELMSDSTYGSSYSLGYISALYQAIQHIDVMILKGDVDGD